MTTTTMADAWLEANQRYLHAELSRIRRLLSSGSAPGPAPQDMDAALDAVEAARAALSVEAPIDLLSELFGLTPFERDVLLLAGGFELDRGVAAAYSASAGESGRAGPTFSMALALLPAAHWSALLPERPLRRWRLLEPEAGVPITQATLRIDERILHFLTGINTLDHRLQPLVRPVEPPGVVAPSHRELASQVAATLSDTDSRSVLQLVGNDRDGRQDVAAGVSQAMAWTLYAIDSADIPTTHSERQLFTTLWSREAVLLQAALLVDASATANGSAVTELLEALGGPVFLSAGDPVALRRASRVFAVAAPDRNEQRMLWQAALGTALAELPHTLDVVAGHTRLSARAIRQYAPEIRAGRDARLVLRDGAGLGARKALDELAVRVESPATWADLVVPPATRALLEEIVLHVRCRHTVYETWGFAARASRGLGIAALFCGESGTGKTMAAEVLANELGLDLYRIDLATVVSKYIGETEKNLRRVFEAAEDSGAILLFDEADALFGKRSEVKDSHDRYANIEVSYLLQRMEAYRGLAILSTNMKAALDRAFQRRLRFVVPFPFPDPEQREAIWRRAFPPDTPTTALEYDRLARLGLSGGSISNIALRAAFLAAGASEPVAMSHVVEAARGEYAKLERTWTESELRGRP